MKVEVACQCGQRFAAESHLWGEILDCPSCGAELEVPVPDPIVVACVCGQQFAAQPHLAGEEMDCPVCGRPLLVPDPSQGMTAPHDPEFWSELSSANQAILQRQAEAAQAAEAAEQAPRPRRIKREPQHYGEVPLHRRNGCVSGLATAHLLAIGATWAAAQTEIVALMQICMVLGFCTTFGVVLACIIVLTGPVYVDEPTFGSQMKTWNNANKVAAVLLVIILVAGWIFAFLLANGTIRI